MKTDKEIRERLRKDLPTIRSVAGWSAERLAELLDVSRVTVVNIENTEGKMTVMQYLAIRALLDAEAKENHNDTLARIVRILVDRDDIPEEKKDELRQQAAVAAKRVGRKAGSAAVGAETVKALKDMKISDIPEDTMLRGMAVVTELLHGKK